MIKYDDPKVETWKKYWSNQTDPQHVVYSEEWFDKYYKEILFYIQGNKTIVDTGCGSGEFLIRMAKDFEQVTGLDYSQTMVNEAVKRINENGIKNVDVHFCDATQLDKIVKKKVDVVSSINAVQYFNLNQLDEFICKSAGLLNENGCIMIMGIPNFNLKILYILKFYHKHFFEKITDTQLLKNIIQYKYAFLKKKIRHPRYIREDPIGFWFTMGELKNLAEKNHLKVEFFYPIYPPYGYRFHVKLTK